MSFKANLLKKIELDNLAQHILASIGPTDSGRKVDKDAMRRMLAAGPYQHQKVRDLDLYIFPGTIQEQKILVLDNDLTIYRTTIADVALRKSPTIKEMVSIRNAIKILSDSDVVVSKKADSLKTIQQECIALLDLSFNEADLDAIRIDGIASLESNYSEGVIEALTLLGELLGYGFVPKPFRLQHHHILGLRAEKTAAGFSYGPLFVYNIIHNILSLIEAPLDSTDPKNIIFFKRVAAGEEKAAQNGPAVFQYLKDAVGVNG